MADNPRAYVSANFWLQLDGLDCGMINSIEGGNIQAEVVSVAASGHYFQKKHLGPIKYNPIKLQMAGIQGGPMYNHIKNLLGMNHTYFNGGINACDFNMETRSTREFENALLTEVGFPACDGAAKDAAYLSVTFEAEKIRTKAGDKSKPSGALNINQKRLLGSNFRLTVDKIKDKCKRIAKVDALTVKSPITRDDIGDAREMELVPAKGVDFPNLSFQVAEVDADAIYQWHEDFVIKGNCGEESETTAELTYLSQDFSKELLRVTMKNVGIFNITSDKNEDHKDAVKRCKIECYMESMEVDFVGA